MGGEADDGGGGTGGRSETRGTANYEKGGLEWRAVCVCCRKLLNVATKSLWVTRLPSSKQVVNLLWVLLDSVVRVAVH